jgi:16S rRNA (cytosine1402-N4)-methyltransferase
MALHIVPCGSSDVRVETESGTRRNVHVLAHAIGQASQQRRRRATFSARRRGQATMTALPPRHIPVLGREVLEWISPHSGGIYVDATFGAGGYSRALLAVDGTRVIGIDRDRTAIAGGFALVDQADGRLTLVEDRFSNLAEVCAAQGVNAVDGVVMDIGVSSMQIDQAERGFSFRLDGPLDMRMSGSGPTAADVVAAASEADLANIIYIFGEERFSRQIARAIVAARRETPIATTRALRKTARRRANRCAGAASRRPAVMADARQRHARRLSHADHPSSRRLPAGDRCVLCLPHQDGIDLAHRARAAAARRSAGAARRHRSSPRRMGEARFTEAPARLRRASHQAAAD